MISLLNLLPWWVPSCTCVCVEWLWLFWLHDHTHRQMDTISAYHGTGRHSVWLPYPLGYKEMQSNQTVHLRVAISMITIYMWGSCCQIDNFQPHYPYSRYRIYMIPRALVSCMWSFCLLYMYIHPLWKGLTEVTCGCIHT